MDDCAYLLPTYASDTSGVASALYELGGMTVIHDASGCNSTYSTFDEPRWYERESFVVISALTESDAVLGNEQKLIDDCLAQARLLHPAFVALANSPLAMLIGCDMEAIAEQIESLLAIPCFALKTNGIQSYVLGASQAFVAVSRRFTKDLGRSAKKSLNLLGATPLDLTSAELTAIRTWAENTGFQINACVAQDCDLGHIERLACGHVNLVLSSTAIALAHELEQRFGTPYVTGRPLGFLGEELASLLLLAADTGKSQRLERWQNPQSRSVALIGESVAMLSMAQALAHYGFAQSRIYCPLEEWQEQLGKEDLAGAENEEALLDFLKGADLIVGDPFYRLLLDDQVPFLPFAHTAFSGRCYLNTQANFIGQGLQDLLAREGLC